jgi:hypothetical protein
VDNKNGTDHIPFLDTTPMPITDDASALLDLLKKSQDIQRDDIKAIGENQMDISERVIANFAAVRTISDGSELLELIAKNPQ